MSKFIEISILKNYSSSNLNRDMDGSPKVAYFGDCQRARISSQCLKRNIRKSEYLKNALGENTIGCRTRRTDILVFEELDKRGDYTQYKSEINKVLNSLGKKDSKDKEDTKDKKETKGSTTIQFYSTADIIKICDILEEAIKEGKFSKDFKLDNLLQKDFNIRPITLDITLFGRMAATKSFSTIEAAMQVSHAISTHKVKLENDFFTAVDDLIEEREDESGSGHLGDFEFNSSCYYEYFNIDVDKVFSNLKNVENRDEIYNIFGPLIKTICLENPKGKQTSYAASVYPSLVMIEVKDTKIPVNYSNAFITPVKNDENGNIVENSIKALSQYVHKMDKIFNIDKKRCWLNVDGKKEDMPENCETFNRLNDLIVRVVELIKEV